MTGQKKYEKKIDEKSEGHYITRWVFSENVVRCRR